MDTITAPDGSQYCVQDIRALYDSRHRELTWKQAVAIELCLYRDMRERDAAVAMGLSPSSPVAIYATQGLKQLLGTRGEEDGGALPALAHATAARDVQGT